MAGTSSSTQIFFDDKTKSWQQRNNLDDAALFANNLREGVNVIFTESEPIRETLDVRNQWSSRLGIPDAFWSETSFRHNGYFGCSTSPYKKGKALTRYDTMFRFIIKTLAPEKGPKDYKWLEMSFFSTWTIGGSLFVCFDAPKDFPQKLETTLQARQANASETIRPPYAFHIILMDFLVSIYDQSILDLSERIRAIEKNRENMRDPAFPGLHEVARHTAHATETAQVAGNVIERMVSECEALAQRQNDDDAEQAMYERLETLRMHHSMMLGIAARSISNEKRLSNEINLLFNTMAQKDNNVNLEIARATKADSVAMKTIAIVTLTFLPATYVSALLGMNLFSYNPDANGGHINYSPDLWLYFVVSILLTAAVLTTWWVWQRRVEMVKSSENQTEEAAKSAGTKIKSPEAP